MQATTGESWEKRYSPSFREADPLRRQSSTKRKRDEVLRLVLVETKLAIALSFSHETFVCHFCFVKVVQILNNCLIILKSPICDYFLQITFPLILIKWECCENIDFEFFFSVICIGDNVR